MNDFVQATIDAIVLIRTKARPNTVIIYQLGDHHYSIDNRIAVRMLDDAVQWLEISLFYYLTGRN